MIYIKKKNIKSSKIYTVINIIKTKKYKNYNYKKCIEGNIK